MEQWIRTVTGDIPAEAMGVTLVHEHLLFDLSAYFEPPPQLAKRKQSLEALSMHNLGLVLRDPFAIRDNLVQDDVGIAIDEVNHYRRAGGTTIVDVSSIGLGRDVAALRVIAMETNLHVVTGCGYYIASSHPMGLREKSVEDIAESMVGEIETGIDGTGIKAGIIGEIGASAPLAEAEQKVLRAAARAQQRTGLAICIHPYFHDQKWHALEYLDILEEEGTNLDKVIICHMDGLMNLDYHKAVARRGAYVELDTFGSEYTRIDKGYEMPKDTQRVRHIAKLAEEGLLEKTLISTDTCFKMKLRRYGGWGYDHILTNVLPIFRHAGLNEDALHRLLVDNPREALAFSRQA